MAIVSAVEAPLIASGHVPLWGALIDHLLKTYRSLLTCTQGVFSPITDSSGPHPQDVFSHLKKWSVSAHGLYNQCEAQYLCGVMHFVQGNHKTSLSLWRSVLDRDPHHLEVYPALTWNCLLLGLNSDAKSSDRHYRGFQSKCSSVTLYKQLCQGVQRYSTLIYLAEGLKAGDKDSLSQFQLRWQSLGLKSAEFDYDVLFAIAMVLQGNRLQAHTAIQSLYHAWPHEWLPSLLWSLLACDEKDLATCDDRVHQALKKAPQQKVFIEQIASAMLTEV